MAAEGEAPSFGIMPMMAQALREQAQRRGWALGVLVLIFGGIRNGRVDGCVGRLRMEQLQTSRLTSVLAINAAISFACAACSGSVATTRPAATSQFSGTNQPHEASMLPTGALSTGIRPPPDATAIAGAPVSNVTLKLRANADTWSVTTLTAPAGEVWHVRVTSNDGSIAHNFVVFTSSSAPDPIFRSDFFSDTVTHTFAIPALPAGQYFFICQIHAPKMIGTLIVE
jgi:plastocyanin